MNRRKFLAIFDQIKKNKPGLPIDFRIPEKKTASTSSFKIDERPPVFSGLTPYSGNWSVKEAAHLLRRTTFGASKSDIDQILSTSISDAVDTLIQPFSQEPPEPINNYNQFDENGNVILEDPNVPYGDSWVDADLNIDVEGYRILSLKSWWLQNIVDQESTIAEKMVLFWHNHIPIQFLEVFFARWDYNYVQTLRRYALGNFKTLIKKITLDKAMLHYLNGQANNAQQPDENYARELQELFCLGKGPNSQYSEADVQAAARVLTGWRVDYRGSFPVIFNPAEHDIGDKQFSSFYNNTVIQGKTGQSGQEELDELLDMIFDNNETALFICRKLYRFFVYHEIDQNTEQNVIEPLAQIFRDNDYEILPVLQTLFKSEHFFDTLNIGAAIKSPLEFMVGLMREFKVPSPSRMDHTTNGLRNNWAVYANLSFFAGLMDQYIGDPPNVAGWQAYYQQPLFDKIWVSTDTLPKRFLFSDYMTLGDELLDSFFLGIDVVETVKELSDPADPNVVIEEILEWVFPLEVNIQVKIVLKSLLLSGQLADYYWTNAWSEYINDPSDPMKYQVVRTRLQTFFYYIMHLEEYQLI